MSQVKEIKKIPMDEVLEHFRSEGMIVTKEEAELIMEFLYFLTESVIRKYFVVD